MELVPPILELAFPLLEPCCFKSKTLVDGGERRLLGCQVLLGLHHKGTSDLLARAGDGGEFFLDESGNAPPHRHTGCLAVPVPDRHLRSSIGTRTIRNRAWLSSSALIFRSRLERVRLSSVMVGLLVYM